MSAPVRVTLHLGLRPAPDALDLTFVPLAEVAPGDDGHTRPDPGFEAGLVVIEAGGEPTRIEDTLRYAVTELCLRPVPVLAAGGAWTYQVFDYADEIQLVADADQVLVSGADVRPVACPRDELLAAFVAAGEQFVDLMPRIRPGYEAYLDTVRPELDAARAALAHR